MDEIAANISSWHVLQFIAVTQIISGSVSNVKMINTQEAQTASNLLYAAAKTKTRGVRWNFFATFLRVLKGLFFCLKDIISEDSKSKKSKGVCVLQQALQEEQQPKVQPSCLSL